ncbi:unnamed protein product [Dovyalis caffra]|uniref:Uncharacterized protein n=1 Tax=Dovyalis caffra TaxID=77055 RepID=A0AAV1QPN1_9ROSI|nr:unnamed protein product [Dovyalis caffra]
MSRSETMVSTRKGLVIGREACGSLEQEVHLIREIADGSCDDPTRNTLIARSVMSCRCYDDSPLDLV